MDAYKSGQNSAIWWIARREIRCPYEYGTMDYNSWFVGFADEMELTGEEMPSQIAI